MLPGALGELCARIFPHAGHIDDLTFDRLGFAGVHHTSARVGLSTQGSRSTATRGCPIGTR